MITTKNIHIRKHKAFEHAHRYLYLTFIYMLFI